MVCAYGVGSRVCLELAAAVESSSLAGDFTAIRGNDSATTTTAAKTIETKTKTGRKRGNDLL